jgi:hypothetical protein
MLTSSLLLDLKSNDSIATAFNEFRAKSSMSKISLNPDSTRSKSKDKLKTSRSGADIGLEVTQLSKNNKYLEEKVIGTMLSIKKLKNISKELKSKESEIENLQKEVHKSEEEVVKKRKKLNWFEDTLNALYTHCTNNDDDGIARVFHLTKNRKLKMKSPRKSLSIEEFNLKSISKAQCKSTKNLNTKSPYDSNAKVLTISGKKLKKNSKLSTRVQAFTPSIKLKSIEKNEVKSNLIGLKLEQLLRRTKNILEILSLNKVHNT